MDCKNCEHNNNGWCKKFNAQKPNALKLCTNKNDSNEEDHYKYVLNGKVQQFHNIILQIDASPDSISIDLKRALYGLYQMLLVEISIHGINFDFEIDKDIFSNLKNRMERWKEHLENK